MKLRKLLSKLNPKFSDPAEEQEYYQLRIPVVDSLFGYLFVTLTILLIAYSIRYLTKQVYVQGYISIAFLVISILLCVFKRRFSRYIEHIVFVYMLVMLGLLLSAARDLIKTEDSTELFYMGYALAFILRLVGYRVLRVRYMIALHAVSIGLKFGLLGSPSAALAVIVVIVECITVLLSYHSEMGERSLFDAMFKARRDTLKFKQLLTEYLPNQMAIFTSDRCVSKYVNKAFKRAFKCDTSSKALAALDSLIIEKETLIKHKNLFTSFGYPCTNDAQPVKLSDFVSSIPRSLETIKELGTINFMVKEEEPRGESIQIAENRIIEEPGTQREGILATTNPLVGRRTPSGRSATRNETKPNHKNTKKSCFGVKEFLFPPKQNFETGRASLDNSKEQSRSFGEDNDSIGLDRAGSRSNFSETQGDDRRKRIFKAKIFLLLWDEVDAIALVLDDVTKQKTISDLRMADKNKDLVIAMVSHELRTPLNGMLGLIDIIKKNLKQPGLLSYINACRNNGVLLLSLVNSILDLSQIKNNKFKLLYTRVNIQDLMSEIKSLFEYFCVLKNIYLNIEIDPDVPKSIVTDRNRLSQIIINLLGNAFKFTFKGGITVRVSLEGTEPNRVRFAVSDTGIGIKAEDQSKLFKLFGRLEHEDKKINTSGVGLGLTISNTLVLLLNPSEEKGIHLDSEPDKGSTFSFAIQDKPSEVQPENPQSEASLENLSMNSIDEDKEIVSKKMSNYTLNCVDTFSRNHNSLQNLDSKLPSPGMMKKGDPYGSLSALGEDVLLLKNQNLTTNALTKRDLDLEIIKDSSDKENNSEAAREEWQMHKQKQKEKEKTQQIQAKKKEINGEKPWCLVVDDNPFNLMVASHLMEEKGYQIKQALNGKDAIKKMTEHQESGKTFQVVLMDCQMPVMDGYEATRILRKMMNGRELSECPIVALTASDRDEEHEKMCREVGMSGTVTKPLQPDELDVMLRKLERANQKAKKVNS